jgi:hypothetical protein
LLEVVRAVAELEGQRALSEDGSLKREVDAGRLSQLRLKDGFLAFVLDKVNVPANAPVTQYWSATAYDRDTHALIRNMQWASRSSQNPDLQKNADGSVDVYFGPKAPAGKESNWVPTSAGGKFEVLFRFFGPQKPLFEKAWKLPDIEKAN